MHREYNNSWNGVFFMLEDEIMNRKTQRMLSVGED
jgi:hypothetical protein